MDFILKQKHRSIVFDFPEDPPEPLDGDEEEEEEALSADEALEDADGPSSVGDALPGDAEPVVRAWGKEMPSCSAISN